MTKKIFITLSIIALFASCGTRGNNNNTFDEGVVINGVRWATRNVDAPGTFAANPESAGMFYQWNRQRGWAAGDRRVIGWDNSRPAGDTWLRVNDPCPPGWRVLTQAELQRLVNAGSTWTEFRGVEGRLLGTAPNQFFLPAVGLRAWQNGRLHNVGTRGTYWSSSLYRTNIHVISLYFYNSSVGVGGFGRTVGYSVRCVAE